MTALKRCGLDYIHKIDALIHQRYQEKLEKEAKAKVKDSFWGKSPIEMLDSFKFFKMSNRYLISEAVEERTALGEIFNWKERNNELER